MFDESQEIEIRECSSCHKKSIPRFSGAAWFLMLFVAYPLTWFFFEFVAGVALDAFFPTALKHLTLITFLTILTLTLVGLFKIDLYKLQ